MLDHIFNGVSCDQRLRATLIFPKACHDGGLLLLKFGWPALYSSCSVSLFIIRNDYTCSDMVEVLQQCVWYWKSASAKWIIGTHSGPEVNSFLLLLLNACLAQKQGQIGISPTALSTVTVLSHFLHLGFLIVLYPARLSYLNQLSCSQKNKIKHHIYSCNLYY